MQPEQTRGSLDAQGTAALIELLMEPSPARHVRLCLSLYRERGYEFEHAWAQTLRTLPRTMPDVDSWRDSLHQNKRHWKDAYGAPSQLPERPLALVE